LGFAACALFFLRFWRRTREELFLAFAIAFLLLGVGQTILALANIPTEERGALYLIRLAAFALILVAIYRKNQTARG
jgi:membrane-associated PAP2 superfamily phosphatase